MRILETPRLILRPPSHSDELFLRGLYSDPFVVNAVLDGVYPTIEQSKAELLRFINHWQHNRFGLWMVFVKVQGQPKEFAGYSGLAHSGPNLPEDPSNVELAHCFHLAASGKGIAPEAGRAAVRFAFEHLELEKVTAFIDPMNTRSLRAAPKVGLCYVRDRIYKNTMMRYLEASPMTAVKTEKLLVSTHTAPGLIPDQ
ncbi:N-acetyltransferase [Mesorhizobium sp. 113-1-2]|uniref:GNAT family N-acetyltransferase n=1 Tax=Mesorhizobium sp. 113-1-2 TaxID=2744515 RepID=UPI001926324B|nr:GNAT family N-acetyltransferase [Mesorhizobium sp. 113-1-2]BCG76073.1 N-acetyltransferase [Mesorhizobium sp. 113-1-2]